MTTAMGLPASRVLEQPPSPAVRFLEERLRGRNARMATIDAGFPDSTMLYQLDCLLPVVSAIHIERFSRYVHIAGPQTSFPTILAVPTIVSSLLDRAAARYFVLAAKSQSPT